LKSNLLRLSLSVAAAATLAGIPHASFASAETAHTFRIQEQWNLGGNGGWGPLLFDAPTRQLYIPRTDRVAVVNTETGKVTGEISGFVDARTVALDDQGKLGFVSDIMDGTAGFVRVFDRSTLKVTASILVGKIPTSVIFDPVTKTVFAFSVSERSASVIDPVAGLVIATFPLPGKPQFALTDRNGAIFVTLRGTGQMIRIDTASHRITATWPLAPCDGFTGLAFDAGRRQLLGSCYDGGLYSVDGGSGSVAPLGANAPNPADIAFDSRRDMLVSASNTGVLTVFHRESSGQYTRLDELTTSPRAGTVTVDSNTGRVYLVTAKFEQRPVSGKGMEELQARLTPIPGSFVVLVVSP
jgi:DNA-binding beta-propeller fold protein YncE